MEIGRVGVVGAGVIGTGVAQSLAQTGHEVVLVDVSPEILASAEKEIRKSLRFQGMFQKGVQTESAGAVVGRIALTTDLADLRDVDFVVENVPEKWEIKREIYPRIDAICPARAVFAVNTSCFSITRVAALTRRPDRVVGMHFMNPVLLKPMVEVIRGYHTSEETLETGRRLLHQMACFGHKMGPLETADLIGLDTILYSIEVLSESFDDSKFRPCPLLRKMVDAGLLGRKSGKGFYDYGD